MADQPPTPALSREPVDPDIDMHVGRQPGHRRGELGLALVVSAGGAVGAGARYLLGLEFPQPPASFPWTTFAINVVGSALIGVLMVLVTDVWTQRRLIRPFLGTGVLGGFTTFSTFAVDIQSLTMVDHAGTGLLYMAGTPVGAVLAVWATASTTRRLITWRRR